MVLFQKSSTSSQKGKEFRQPFCCPSGSEFQILLQFPLVIIPHKWTANTSVDSKDIASRDFQKWRLKGKSRKAGHLPSYESPSFPFWFFCFLGSCTFCSVSQLSQLRGQQHMYYSWAHDPRHLSWAGTCTLLFKPKQRSRIIKQVTKHPADKLQNVETYTLFIDY